MENSDQVISLDQRRRIVFCSLVFDALTELDDLSWMDEQFKFIEGLRSKYGLIGVTHCRLYHASCGSSIPAGAVMELFDFEGDDSILLKMFELGATFLDPEYFEAIRKSCRMKED